MFNPFKKKEAEVSEKVKARKDQTTRGHPTLKG
jgi:hypothetical protein